MKNLICKFRNKALSAMALIGFICTQVALTVNANNPNGNNVTGAAAVTAKMGEFFAIVAALVSAVGAVMLLWGVFEFGVSMGDQQGTMQAGALKRVGGGIVMIIAPQIVAALAPISGAA